MVRFSCAASLRQLADRCDVLTYEFENGCDGLDAVIKDGPASSRDQTSPHFSKSHFEKDFLSNKAQVTVAPYKVVTSSQDLADIDLSKNYVLKTATGGTMAMVRRSFVQVDWKKPMP